MYLIVCFYHSQMNSEIFQNWFENMLQLLEEPCIIVIDKYVSYHRVMVENIPKSNIRNMMLKNG